MASGGVQPLRINKGSPGKMNPSAIPRPLSEISPMGVRRNSPSFNQNLSKKPSLSSTRDSSPFDASPAADSPLHSFWKSRENASPQRPVNNENNPLQHKSPSPAKRSSIENLKKASRVTNSTMYAREQESDFDPDASSILSARPLSSYSANVANAWGDLRSNPSFRGHGRTESNSKLPALSRTPSPTKPASPSPIKQTSPHKSSLSVNSRYGPQNLSGLDDSMFDDGTESRPDTRSNTPRALRAPKSVTFDAQPPQINEYEKVTPDPSSVASGSREGSQESDLYDMDESFEHGSFEREDSFDESLEDAHKTPVVLPEDWRFMSPDAANTDLAETFDDPFEKPQPAFTSPSLRYRGTPERDVGVTRSNSVTSSGEHRPLPPLPAGMTAQHAPSSHPTFTGNRLDPNFVEPVQPFHDEQRATSASSTSALPMSRPASMVSPPRPASMSKADVLGMRASPMPLEDRLQLLSIQNEEAARKAKEAESRLAEEQAQAEHEPEPVLDYKPPPRVSRESILRKVQNRSFNEDEQESSPYSPVDSSSAARDDIDYANLDPDVPIPSRETSSAYEDENTVQIKREEDNGSTIDMYAQMNGEVSRSLSPFDDFARESSVIHHHIPDEDDSELSNEETVMVDERPSSRETQSPSSEHVSRADDGTLPIEAMNATASATPSIDNSRMSLPEFSSFFEKDDFGFGLTSYLTPSPPQELSSKPSTLSLGSHLIERKPILKPATPPQQNMPLMASEQPVEKDMEDEEQVRTPDSVIHHPSDDQSPLELAPAFQAPEVPEPVATIKASGSRLKTRVSATPADLRQMAASRRQVSGELPPPHIEESSDGSRPGSRSSEQQLSTFNRRQSIRKLEMPMDGLTGGLGLGLDEEFDRLLEAKKKGYVTREATRVVVANSRQVSGESKASETSNEDQTLRSTSARGTKSAGNSPRKNAADTWTTEPWNGRMRRQSTRRTNIVSDKRTSLGPVPPMPGQESNVASALDTVTEDQNFDDVDESGERGRLFVKVVGVKDLDLPLPKNERSYFQMTLDNGLHCVTTSWAELGKTAPIGQEFELVVFDDLEFQLLLQTRLERPKSAANSVQSCASSTTTKKASAFSRLFVSPKKRREAERKQQEEEARLAEERRLQFEAQRANRQPSAWDLQNELVGADGSFARAYVALSNHEQHAYGRPFTVDVPAWNEWAVEDKTGASTRSKMGGVQRKPPYKIGTIELQLMYIPRPRDATDEDMPKSMSAAIRQLKEAEATVTRQFEGHLSQQGGDCPFWRRRFFKLNGSKLTAYHDTTRQPRATISLAKATKLIDDKSSLTKTDDNASPKKGKGRRKSAFAEDEEGYMFIEDAFRLKFANGEVIDFYADSHQIKEDWMKVLGEAVGRESPGEKKTWMTAVLDRERAALAAQAPSTKLHSVQRELVQPRNTTKSAPTSPRKEVLNAGPFTNASLKETRPPPIEKSPRHEVLSPTNSKHRTSASTSAVVSPSKPVNTSRSPLKRDSSPSKRNSAATGSTSSAASASSSPRKPVTSRRMAVRSMIF